MHYRIHGGAIENLRSHFGYNLYREHKSKTDYLDLTGTFLCRILDEWSGSEISAKGVDLRLYKAHSAGGHQSVPQTLASYAVS